MMPKLSGYAVALVLAVLLACAGCGEIPEEDGGGGGLWGSTPTPTAATPTPTPTYLIPATPINSPTITNPPTSSPTPTPEAIEYFEIYTNSIDFNYDVISYVYDLRYPPMVIEFEVHPELVEREVVKTSDYGTKEKVTITQLLPHDLAEFKLTVYDKNTGDIVAEEGYGRAFSSTSPDRELVIRVPGLYQIEMTGAYVNVDISFEVAPENIPPQ